MRKINLFNRNTNLPSYRRKPVSRGIVENRHTAEARCLGQAKRGLAPQEIFHCETMKNINVCDASFCIRKNWIPAFAGMTGKVRGVVENRHTAEARCPGIAIAMTCPAGDFSSQGDEKHNVCDASFCIRKNWIPAFAGMTAKICGITMIVIAALFAVPAMATHDEIDQKTVTSKYYVDQELATKQDKMTCAGYLAGHENDEDYCWLYNVAPVTTQCLAYYETATSPSQCCSGVLQQGKGGTLINKCGCVTDSDCTNGLQCKSGEGMCWTAF